MVTNRWFKLPLIEDEVRGDVPKYAQKVNQLEGRQISDRDRAVVRFVAEEDVLDEIASESDAEVLSQFEGRCIYYSERETTDGEENNQPIADGSGETLEERVEDYIQNSKSFYVNNEMDIAEPTYFRPPTAFLEKPPQLLTLEELRKFPRYLCDLLLQSPMSTISGDHWSYWLWTAEFAQFEFTNHGSLRNLENNRVEPDSLGGFGLILDFIITLQYASLPIRFSQIDQTTEEFFFAKIGINQHHSQRVLGILGPSAFSFLIGLVKAQSDLISPDGNAVDEIEITWHPHGDSTSGRLPYSDILQTWRVHESEGIVKETLDLVDDLTRYNDETIQRLGGVLGNESTYLREEEEGTSHLLAVISEQRNYMTHGKGSSGIAAPLAISLACLVIWQFIEEDTFESTRESILQQSPTQLTIDNLGPGR